MNWTDEKADLLRRLWAEGLGAGEIADRIGGVTRNAVIGKAHRLNLSGRVPRREPAARKAKPKAGVDAAHSMPPAPRRSVSAARKAEPEIAAASEFSAEQRAWLSAEMLALKEQARRISQCVDETSRYIARQRADMQAAR